MAETVVTLPGRSALNGGDSSNIAGSSKGRTAGFGPVSRGSSPCPAATVYYTYILKSIKNDKLYVGSTSDLRKRFQEHNTGKGGKYTKANRPFKLIYYEAYTNKELALKAEKFYKTGNGRAVLKRKLGLD